MAPNWTRRPQLRHGGCWDHHTISSAYYEPFDEQTALSIRVLCGQGLP